MNVIEKWKIYEDEKRKLEEKNLAPEEYTKCIVELCRRLEL